MIGEVRMTEKTISGKNSLFKMVSLESTLNKLRANSKSFKDTVFNPCERQEHTTTT